MKWFPALGCALRNAFGSPLRSFAVVALWAGAVMTPLPATAEAGGAITVKLNERALPPGASALPPEMHTAVEAAFGAALTPGGRTRDGAFILTLPAPLDTPSLRAALNRVRLDPAVLYASPLRAAAAPATTGRPTDRMIVKYRDAGAASRGQADVPPDAARMTRLSAAAGAPVGWVRRSADGADVLQLLARLPIAQAEAVAAQIALDPDVEYAQPDYIRTAQLVPSDPCYASASVSACNNGYQWDLFDPVGGINMPGAWAITTGAAGIRVAVLDTGALVNHPDLAGRYVGGYDMVADCAVGNDFQPAACTWSGTYPNNRPNLLSRDPSAADPGDWITANESAGLGAGQAPYDWFLGCYVDGSSWHGTHVAGTIGAVPNNGIGIAGINWVSQIVPVRVLGKCGGYTSDIADAMVWAAGGSVAGTPVNANPARVLNLSLGGGGSCDAATQTAINTALSLGTVVVVSAGNANANASTQSPASCSGVITVAATTKLGKRARYSNWGAAVDIAAPGGNADGVDPDILSTLNSGTQAPSNNGYNYVRYAGTSMAAPHVTGVASLMLSANPSLTPAQVLSKIQTTARAFPTPGPACTSPPQASACNCTTALCGAGILDATAAVAAALNAGAALVSSANPAGAGTAVTFTSTVVGNAPTGTVQVRRRRHDARRVRRRSAGRVGQRAHGVVHDERARHRQPRDRGNLFGRRQQRRVEREPDAGHHRGLDHGPREFRQSVLCRNGGDVHRGGRGNGADRDRRLHLRRDHAVRLRRGAAHRLGQCAHRDLHRQRARGRQLRDRRKLRGRRRQRRVVGVADAGDRADRSRQRDRRVQSVRSADGRRRDDQRQHDLQHIGQLHDPARQRRGHAGKRGAVRLPVVERGSRQPRDHSRGRARAGRRREQRGRRGVRDRRHAGGRGRERGAAARSCS